MEQLESMAISNGIPSNFSTLDKKSFENKSQDALDRQADLVNGEPGFPWGFPGSRMGVLGGEV